MREFKEGQVHLPQLTNGGKKKRVKFVAVRQTDFLGTSKCVLYKPKNRRPLSSLDRAAAKAMDDYVNSEYYQLDVERFFDRLDVDDER
jgi:hypothetical protein